MKCLFGTQREFYTLRQHMAPRSGFREGHAFFLNVGRRKWETEENLKNVWKAWPPAGQWQKLFRQKLTMWAPITLKSQSLGCPPGALRSAGTQSGEDGAVASLNWLNDKCSGQWQDKKFPKAISHLGLRVASLVWLLC